jgi:hypothetical protein
MTFLAVADMIVDATIGYDAIENKIKDLRAAHEDKLLRFYAKDETSTMIERVTLGANNLINGGLQWPSIYEMSPSETDNILEVSLFRILEASFYSDGAAERERYLNTVVEYLESTGYSYPDIEKEIQLLKSIPSDMDLENRIVFAAQHSYDKTSALAPCYTKTFSYSYIIDKGNEEDDPKDPNRPNNHGDMPDRYYDPLVIDLNRDGTVNTTQDKRYFDLDADGLIEQTAWAASGEGILALDRDGDGRITSGRELFGDRTVMSNGKVASSGFQALADLDSNRDGIIDSNDAMFAELHVWADKDADGVFGDEELFTLEELGIKSMYPGSCVACLRCQKKF